MNGMYTCLHELEYHNDNAKTVSGQYFVKNLPLSAQFYEYFL